ncbi:hypothetical protein GCM10027456_47390 [Kineosporia babensis]
MTAGQAVRALNDMRVTPFQHGMHTVGGIGEHLGEQGAPAMPGSGGKAGADPVGGGQSLLEDSEHHVADGVGSGLSFGGVYQRMLNLQARWTFPGIATRVQITDAMNDDARWCADPARPGYADLDRARALSKCSM